MYIKFDYTYFHTFLKEMWQKGLEPDVITYSTAVESTPGNMICIMCALPRLGPG